MIANCYVRLLEGKSGSWWFYLPKYGFWKYGRKIGFGHIAIQQNHKPHWKKISACPFNALLKFSSTKPSAWGFSFKRLQGHLSTDCYRTSTQSASVTGAGRWIQ
jgi:hypothetical protein